MVLLFTLALLLVLITRLPLFPAHLYSFDSVNLALALKEFDPSRSQPQPPGYPFFVAEARFFHLFLGTPEQTFAAQACLIAALGLGMLYLLGRRMFSSAAGLIAAALLFVNPIFWFSGLTSPLRLHLALISVLVAYCCWRALSGEPKFFYAASIALGLGSGFRPELLLLLLPLWAWTGWQCEGRWFRLIRGSLLLGTASFLWILVLVVASGGIARTLSIFSEYLFSQTNSTSLFSNPQSGTWLHYAGRAVIWNALGTIPWIWAAPFGWLRRSDLRNWMWTMEFLAIWFLPSFAFYFSVHVGDPDHTLTTVPVLCMVGAFCLVSAQEAFARWFPDWKEARGLVIGAALVISTSLFFAQILLPRKEPTTSFRAFQSAADVILYGTYEASYKQVVDIAVQTDAALVQIEKLRLETERPVLLLWSIYAEPTWRKVCYYFPSDKVYAFYENKGPGASGTRAQLWSSTNLLAAYNGTPPFQIPLPKGARLIWLLNKDSAADLTKTVALREATPVYYMDLPENSYSFRWGSFEFVPEN